MTTCRICRHSDENREYTVREMLCGTRDEFRYFVCSACGCLQIGEIPPDMSAYYPGDYYSFNATAKPEPYLKRLPKRMRNRFAVFDEGLAGRILYACKQDTMGLRSLSHVPVTREMRIIDVGCGDGRLLCSLHELGFRHLLGVDPYIAGEIVHGNGVRILKDELARIGGSWDLVMFHHSLEHIPDQLDTLKAARRILSGGGVCLVRIPVSSSHAWRHYGVNWFQLDAPRHFFLHTVASMGLLAKEAGFTVERVVFDSTSLQFTGSELYARDIPLTDPGGGGLRTPESFYSGAELRRYAREARRLNAQSDGDQAAFYLRGAL